MKVLTAVLVLPALLLTGCPRDREEALTVGEATHALEQASDAGRAEGLAAASVDIATHFTLGATLNDAAEELRAFIDAQLPCAEVMLDDATVTVEYGVKGGNCSYRGHALSGQHVIRVERNEEASVEVHHVWKDFSNGVLQLDGTADVTWSFADETRRVKHESHWTHLESGRTGAGSGDRLQSPLAEGLAQGIRVDGERAWEGERGHWDLAIDGVLMRWTDPVPYAGTYTLSTPFAKSLSMSFARLDDDTIEVEVEGRRRSFVFTVSRLGAINQSE